MIEPVWEIAPKWANYFTVDEDGVGWWFENEPKSYTGGDSTGYWDATIGDSEMSTIIFPDWESSMRRRVAPESNDTCCSAEEGCKSSDEPYPHVEAIYTEKLLLYINNLPESDLVGLNFIVQDGDGSLWGFSHKPIFNQKDDTWYRGPEQGPFDGVIAPLGNSVVVDDYFARLLYKEQ